jgi:hypothetical protein
LEKITLIEYQGFINYETIGELIHRLKLQVPKLGIQTGIYKRVLLVMIESLENMMKHGISSYEGKENPCLSTIHVSRYEKKYRIYTTNCISNNNIPDLKKRLDFLNGLDQLQLKNVYKETITNGEFTEAGGAGLGLIEMVKISGNPIAFKFEQIDDAHTLYQQTVTIDYN